MISPEHTRQIARNRAAENKKFLSKLKSCKPRDLDRVMAQLHEEVFIRINCLACANCCKSLGPRLTMSDIERLSRHLRQKPEVFIANYLRIDEDGDYVFRSMPCPFLGTENYCKVYELRPKACAAYPHTNQRKFHQILDITLKNTFTCPAVLEIVEELKTRY